MPLPPRRVTLVLCTAADGVLGVLPPFEVATPYWQEVREVVGAARTRHGLDVTVLRLLCAAEESPPRGGDVTYLAEVGADDVDDAERAVDGPWTGPDPLAEQRFRMPWARPGGPTEDLYLADEVLRAHEFRAAGAPQQLRTWNLSSIWRLPVLRRGGTGDVWLKAVPPFMAHEGRVLRLLGETAALPRTLHAWVDDRDGCGRVLLEDVRGEDQYGAPAHRVAAFAAALTAVQLGSADQLLDLLALGVPDRSDPYRLVLEAHRLVDLVSDQVDDATRDGAHVLAEDVPAMVARARECGVPDALVHGDFHAGNVRGVPGRWVVLDWGDSYVGQPLVDLVTAGAGLDAAGRRHVVATAAAVRGLDDLAEAVDSVRPLAPLRAALQWQRFLDHIEPDERVYHAGDPAAGLRDAVAAHRGCGR